RGARLPPPWRGRRRWAYRWWADRSWAKDRLGRAAIIAPRRRTVATALASADNGPPRRLEFPMASLQDQLLKAGVVDAKKAQQLKHEKHKQTKQQPQNKPVVDEAKAAARQALAGQAARDREINRQKQE